MSNTPKINLNSVLTIYNNFESESRNGKDVCSYAIKNPEGTPRVVNLSKTQRELDKKSGCVEVMRNECQNDITRFHFFKSVADQFGGADKIPPKVRDVLRKNGFDDAEFTGEVKRSQFIVGTQLEARNIKAVVKAITSATCADANLLADNFAGDIRKCLSGGKIDAEEFKRSMQRFFDAALPPKWETSKNFDAKILKDDLGAGSIRDLRRAVSAKIDELVKDAQKSSFDREGTTKCLLELQVVLTLMRELFVDSKVGKDRHVDAFLKKFNEAMTAFDQNPNGDPARKDGPGDNLGIAAEPNREELRRPPFTRAELSVLEAIAKCADDGSAGNGGDAGCMAFSGGGPVRFRAGSSRGLTPAEKRMISDATNGMKTKLVAFANKISSDMGEIVGKLLEIKTTNDVDLLRCTDVLKAISYMRPFISADGGTTKIAFCMGAAVTERIPAYPGLKAMATACAEVGRNTATSVRCNYEGDWALDDFAVLTTERVGDANEGSLVVVTREEEGKEVKYLQRTYDEKTGKTLAVSKEQAQEVVEQLVKVIKRGLEDVLARMYLADVPENLMAANNNAFRMLHDSSNSLHSLINIDTMNGGYEPLDCKRIGKLVQRIKWLKECSVDQLVAMSAAGNRKDLGTFLSTDNEKIAEEFKSKFSGKGGDTGIAAEEQIEDPALPENPFGEIEPPVVKPDVQAKPVIEPSLVNDYEAVTAKLEKCRLPALQSAGMEFLMRIFPDSASYCQGLVNYLNASNDQERRKALEVMRTTNGLENDPLLKELIAEPLAKYNKGQMSADEFHKTKYNQTYPNFVQKKLAGIWEPVNALLGKTAIVYNPETRSFSFGKSEDEVRAVLKELMTLAAKRNDGLYANDAIALGVGEKQAAFKALDEHLFVVEGPFRENYNGVISKSAGCEHSRLRFAGLNFLDRIVPELAKYRQLMRDYPGLMELLKGDYERNDDGVAKEIMGRYIKSPWNMEVLRYELANPRMSPSGDEIVVNIKKNELKQEECFRSFFANEIAGILKPINDNLMGGKITFDATRCTFGFGKNESEARNIMAALVTDYVTEGGYLSRIGSPALGVEAKNDLLAKLEKDLSLVDEPFAEAYGKLSQAMTAYRLPALQFAGEKFLKQLFPDLAKYLACYSDFNNGSSEKCMAVIDAVEKNSIQISGGRKFSDDVYLKRLYFLRSDLTDQEFQARKIAIFQEFIWREIRGVLEKVNSSMPEGVLTLDLGPGGVSFGGSVEQVRRSLQELVVAYAKKDSALLQIGALDLDTDGKLALLAKITDDLAEFKEAPVPSAVPVTTDAVKEKAPVQEAKRPKHVAQEPTVLKIPTEPEDLGSLAAEGNELSREFSGQDSRRGNALERGLDVIWDEPDTREWIKTLLNLFTDYTLELKDADAYTRKTYLDLLGKINEIVGSGIPDWRLFETVQNEIKWVNGQAYGDERESTVNLLNSLGKCMALAENYYSYGGTYQGHGSRPAGWVNRDQEIEKDPRFGAVVPPFSPGVIEVDKVRTDLRIEEVGGTAPNHNYALRLPEGLLQYGIANPAVWDALEANCKGDDCRQGFALAFNLLSDHLPGLRNAPDTFKSDYLAMLTRAEGLISRADPKDSARLYVALSREIQTLFAKYNTPVTWAAGMFGRVDPENRAQYNAALSEIQKRLTEYGTNFPGGRERALLSGMHNVLDAVWRFYGAKEAAVPPQDTIQLKNFAPEEIGAKATAFDTVLKEKTDAIKQVGELELNSKVLARELQVNCRGRDCLQWIAYALNLASEKDMGFRKWNSQQRQDYLFMLNECGKDIASVYQRQGDAVGDFEFEHLNADGQSGKYRVGSSSREVDAEVYKTVTGIVENARKEYLAFNDKLNVIRGRQSDRRIVETVRGMLPGDVNGAEIKVVDNSGKNFNCLFYSIQMCLDGGRKDDHDAAQTMRINLHDKARQVIDSASNGNYNDAFRQAATNNEHPYFKEDINKIALLDYLVDVERRGQNIFADASLLSLVPDIIHRPVVLLNDLSMGEGQSFQTNTYKSGNAEWDANEPIYIYYNGFNHYKAVVVKHAEVEVGQNDASQAQNAGAASEPSEPDNVPEDSLKASWIGGGVSRKDIHWKIGKLLYDAYRKSPLDLKKYPLTAEGFMSFCEEATELLSDAFLKLDDIPKDELPGFPGLAKFGIEDRRNAVNALVLLLRENVPDFDAYVRRIPKRDTVAVVEQLGDRFVYMVGDEYGDEVRNADAEAEAAGKGQSISADTDARLARAWAKSEASKWEYYISLMIDGVKGEQITAAGGKNFDNADREVIDEIAASAFGSGDEEDVNGGEGFMGVYNGEMTKFLTHSGERKNIGKDLSQPEKNAINLATGELRSKLTALAGKLMAGPEKDEIMHLLKPKTEEVISYHGLDLLSRKTVAKIVTLLAGYADLVGQKLINLQELELADTVDDTSFKAIFKREQKFAADLVEAEKTAVAKTKNSGYGKIVSLLANDKDVDDAAAEIDEIIGKDKGIIPIVDCRKVISDNTEKVANLAQQFAVESGYTQVVAAKYKEDQTCALVFADGHYFACGLPQMWRTQEETVLRDMLSPKMAAWMLKNGFIKKTVVGEMLRYEYTDKLYTTGGGYLLTDPITGRKFMFFSMPSLTRASNSFDLRGNISWLNDARRGMQAGSELTPVQRRNATKFLEEFYDLTKKGKTGLADVEDYALAMKYLLFVYDNRNFNILAHRRTEDVKREVRKFLAFVKEQLAVNRDEFVKKAENGYNTTVSKAIERMMIAARKAGVKNFVGGPIGAGAFNNDVNQVAGLFSNGFSTCAGKEMRYIYPVRVDKDLSTITDEKKKKYEIDEQAKAKKQREAFEAAFRKV